MRRARDPEVARPEADRPGAAASPEETDYKPTDWKKLFRKKYIPYHIIGLALIGLTIWMSVKHDEIVDTLRPFSEKVRDVPAGWLIPIAILIIISIPPLFGHEIVGLLCGIVYGLWIGFAVLAVGTFLGEVLTFYLFKYALRKTANKLERTNLTYAALTRLINEGGFWRRFLIVTVIRFSAMPAHLSTAVFATCGIGFWIFAIATAVTLPKQLFLVYLGVLFLQGANNDNKLKTIMFGVAGALTVLAAVWIIWKLRAYKVVLMEEQNQRRAQREMTSVPKPPPFVPSNRDSLDGSDSSSGGTTDEITPHRMI
ncbi:hypothetical protein GQ53DRAFT_784591 [Thozetella sp. PMI_491]|nr:hypothetical protein GQ53DRAFT_784591 [Thozetella sp. PMI_491]